MSSGESVTLAEQQIEGLVEITSVEAEEIARLFIEDMVNAGGVSWDETTDVVNVFPMYNENCTEITAYTVNLSTGYIVVSAYLDAASLIPEWSDTENPMYENFDITINDNIIYLGGYGYYLDNGSDNVLDLYSKTIKKIDYIIK